MYKTIPILTFFVLILSAACKKSADYVPPNLEPEVEFYVKGTLIEAADTSDFLFEVGYDQMNASSVLGYTEHGQGDSVYFALSNIGQMYLEQPIDEDFNELFAIYGISLKFAFPPGEQPPLDQLLTSDELRSLIPVGTEYLYGDGPRQVEVSVNRHNPFVFDPNDEYNLGLPLSASTIYVDNPGSFEVVSHEPYNWTDYDGNLHFGSKVQVRFHCRLAYTLSGFAGELQILGGEGVFLFETAD